MKAVGVVEAVEAWYRPMRYLVVPKWVSGISRPVMGPAPRLGEHTAEVVDRERA
ncbi:hypothetical protein [Nocardia miyunensis]|uniref:hypothetical protein n=1 Tax=Nocardia miyunensis TaxID=282684 RepID=UPI000A60D7D9|nr:hypothetical protein [Nocardia miyunensis]